MADKITQNADGELNVSDNPMIPFIEGDGIGVDIWPASKLVLDAAAKKYGKTIEWKEVLAGQKAFDETGEWLPEQTVSDFREYLIGIKGPLMPIRCSRKAVTVSSGSHSPVSSKAFCPASTSFQAIERPCLAAAASKTRRDAGQMSTPVPSPSMKGMMGWSGTVNCPSL